MRRLARPATALIATPRQLTITFDPGPLRGICPSDREVVLASLTNLLLEAADVAAEERDDGER